MAGSNAKRAETSTKSVRTTRQDHKDYAGREDRISSDGVAKVLGLTNLPFVKMMQRPEGGPERIAELQPTEGWTIACDIVEIVRLKLIGERGDEILRVGVAARRLNITPKQLRAIMSLQKRSPSEDLVGTKDVVQTIRSKLETYTAESIARSKDFKAMLEELFPLDEKDDEPN